MENPGNAPAEQPATEEAPEKALPTMVDPVDRLGYLLAAERFARVEAQLMLVQEQYARLDQQYKAAGLALKAKYSLGPRDALDQETGEIKRA